ncbi:MAG TPA: glycoside hydrolase family 16 protein [Puia sp.]
MKKIVAFIVAAFILAAANAQSKIAGSDGKVRDTLFFDDFNGKILDRSKWNVEITGQTNNDEQQAYVDSDKSIFLVKGKYAEGARDGALVLKPLYDAGFTSRENKKYDFLSGRINTRGKFEFAHGTASARMKISSGEGLWPAFWLLGEGEWPACGEIDIMETVGDSSWVSHALHGPGYFGDTPLGSRSPFPKGTDVTQWHVYSVDWSSDSLVFKVDGKRRYLVTRQMVEKYGKWAFDNNKFIILNFAIGGGYPHGVNKITKPYFGLSQRSVNNIKDGKVTVLVDWVLITKNR